MDNFLNKISLTYQLNKISHLIFHYNWSSANSILKTYIFLAEVAIVGPVEHSEPCNLTTETNSSHLQISTGMTTFKLCSRLLHPNVSEFKQATINNHISVKPFFTKATTFIMNEHLSTKYFYPPWSLKLILLKISSAIFVLTKYRHLIVLTKGPVKLLLWTVCIFIVEYKKNNCQEEL